MATSDRSEAVNRMTASGRGLLPGGRGERALGDGRWASLARDQLWRQAGTPPKAAGSAQQVPDCHSPCRPERTWA